MEFVNEKLIEFNNYLNGKKVAIIGLGVSNLPLLKYMNNQNAKITIFDEKEEENIPRKLLEKLDKYNANYFFGKNCLENLKNFVKWLKSKEIEIVDISLPNIDIALPVYYIIAPAEATSNLARFDGVKYTSRAKNAKNLDEIYKMSRSEGFGKEVKRRIMLGNYVLSSGYYDAYYKKAKRIQGELIKQFNRAFESCDIIIMPTTLAEAYKIGSKSDNPVDTYKEDIFTVTANIVGIPSLSIPFGKGEHGMPLGVQLMARKFNEKTIYNLAKFLEEERGE